MPSTPPSSAFVAFREALSQPQALLSIERQYPDPPGGADRAAVEGLRAGAIVLMVASFEAYLRDVFEERLDELGASISGTGFDRLPDRLRVAAVFNLLEESMSGRAGRSLPPEKKDRITGIQAAATHVSERRIVGAAFSATRSNPSSSTVMQLFKQIDCAPVFERIHPRFQRYWGSPGSRGYVATQLDFLVNARHEVAHGANVLSWSRDDLKSAERFIRHCARALDDELRVHLNSVRRGAA